MHTDAQLTDGPFQPRKDSAERHAIARFHVSQFPARLALARWQNGGDQPHLHPGVPALRAAFYEGTRRDFQAWLECGGFHAADFQTADDTPAPAPRKSQPVPDGDTQQVGTCN